MHYIRTESIGERERLTNLACHIGAQLSPDDVPLFLWRILELAWLLTNDD